MKGKLIKSAGVAVGIVFLAILILVQGGFFDGEKIGSGSVKDTDSADSSLNASVHKWVMAEKALIPLTYKAVGTVQARIKSAVSSQVTARIEKILVRSGDKIKSGQLLIKLDDREFKSRLARARKSLQTATAQASQAERAVEGAKALFSRDKLRFERMQKMFDSNIISSQDMEAAKASFLHSSSAVSQAKEALNAAKSMVSRSRDLIREAEISLGYTEIRSPEAGEVVERLAEAGDMALAGKPLLELNMGDALQLSALVREGMISRILIGQLLDVEIDSRGVIKSSVEEIVPSADPQTRTFIVKAALIDPVNVYPGMFGRLLIPDGTKNAVLIPKAAVDRIGQLEMVTVKTASGFERVNVKTGQLSGESIEILAGIEPGEEVAAGGRL